MKKRVLIVAGEASGDHHGAALVREVAKRWPQVEFYGIGAGELRSAGVETVFDSSSLAVIGIWEVMGKLGRVVKALRWIKRNLKNSPPDLVVLIDFPDFNFRVAGYARKRNIPVLYYISPQVWAWRQGRVKAIARNVDKMMVIFPFEVDFYRRHGVEAEFVGHPLVEKLNMELTAESAREMLHVPPEALCIGLLPGSRKSEIDHILPSMLSAAEIILGSYPQARFVLPLADTVQREDVDQWLHDSTVPVAVVERNFEAAVKSCQVAMVASGTATLHTALLGVPITIVYKVSPLSYLIGRMFIRVDFIGIVNLIAGKQVVQELVQHHATPRNMAATCMQLLNDPKKRENMVEDYRAIRAKLSRESASQNAARVLVNMLNISKN